MQSMFKGGLTARWGVEHDETKDALVACVDLFNNAGSRVKQFCLAVDLKPIRAEVDARLRAWHEKAHAAKVAGEAPPPYPLAIVAPPAWVPDSWGPPTPPQAQGAPLGGGAFVGWGWGLSSALSKAKNAATSLVKKVGWKSIANDVDKVLSNPKLVGVVPGLGATYAAVKKGADLLKSADKGSQAAQAALNDIYAKAASGDAIAAHGVAVLSAIYQTAAKGAAVEAEAEQAEEEGTDEGESEVSGIATAIGYGYAR